jgi:F0F1-type ATP synthase membrane subunit b/b'
MLILLLKLFLNTFKWKPIINYLQSQTKEVQTVGY